MRKFLLVLTGLILVLFLALMKLDFVSSVFPGWNSHINDNRFYAIVFLQNLIIPVFLYFCIRRMVSIYIFSGYFFIVNILFIVSKSLVYDNITPGLGNQNFQAYMALQRLLIYSTLSIHLIFYVFLYLKLKKKTN